METQHVCVCVCVLREFVEASGLKTFSSCYLSRCSWVVVTMSCTGEQQVSLWLPTLPNRLYWRTLPSQVFIHHNSLCTTLKRMAWIWMHEKNWLSNNNWPFLQVSRIHLSVFTVSLVPIVINQGLPAVCHALLIHTLIREPLRANPVRRTNIQVRVSAFLKQCSC